MSTKTVAEALRKQGLNIEILIDHFHIDEEDEVWLDKVCKKGWVVFTKDKRLKNRPSVRAIMEKHNGRIFSPGGNTRGKDLAELLIKILSKIARFIKNKPSPYIVSISKEGNLNTLKKYG